MADSRTSRMDDEMDTKIIYPNGRSPTPEFEEEFDQDKEWTYEIVSEEVGYKGAIRHEIRWKEWKSKKDGANNTWNEADIPEEAIAAYDKAQAQKRKEKARLSSDIPIYGGRDIMNVRTIMRAEAYQEKLQQHRLEDDDLPLQLKQLDETGHVSPPPVPDSSESDADMAPSPSRSPSLPRPPPLPRRSIHSSHTASSSKAPSSASSRATTLFSKGPSSSSSRATTMSTSSLKRKASFSPTPSGSEPRGRRLTKKTPSRPMISSSSSDNERTPSRSVKRPRKQPRVVTESPSPPPILPMASTSRSTLESQPLPHRAKTFVVKPLPPRTTASSSLFLQAPVASSSKSSHPAPIPRSRPPVTPAKPPVDVIDLVSDDEIVEILKPPLVAVRRPSVPVKKEPVIEEINIDISSDDDEVHRLVGKEVEDDDDDELLLLNRAPVETRAIILGRIWTAKAAKVGAASITFVNDIDDEEVPDDLPRDFEYIENKYIYPKDITHPDKHPKDAWIHCTHESCKRPDQCDCQPEGETWEIYQKRRITGEVTSRRAFAYDNSKNFSFLFDSKLSSKCVVECNQYCACDMSCPNRVAQRPRQIPIEIFKTKRCGWGARSSVSVNRGNVLGVYTGEILNREAAKHTKNPGYAFDLDWLDDVDDDAADDLTYSVQSFNCGNWTRFVNHSCDPNVGVYMVSYDSLPDMNTPYIAFTALKRIRAGEEFTFDYQPRTPKGAVMEKPRGAATPCRCGTRKCCGWL